MEGTPGPYYMFSRAFVILRKATGPDYESHHPILLHPNCFKTIVSSDIKMVLLKQPLRFLALCYAESPLLRLCLAILISSPVFYQHFNQYHRINTTLL